MKKALIAFTVLIIVKSAAQTSGERNVLEVSGKMSNWEVDLKIDSLANLFDEK